MTAAVAHRPAVILLSGGLDSTTTLAMAKDRGFLPFCISFDYGQKQRQELVLAERIAKMFGALEHRLMQIDLASFGGSALVSKHLDVPKDAPTPKGVVPSTYVPARNTIFLAMALAWAEVLGAWDIFIGVNHIDYSGYPDCRPAFIAAFEAMANLALIKSSPPIQKLRIHAPLLHLNKAQIIQVGVRLGVDYRLTHSCYDPIKTRACGRCEACRLRREGFVAAGIADPTAYA